MLTLFLVSDYWRDIVQSRWTLAFVAVVVVLWLGGLWTVIAEDVEREQVRRRREVEKQIRAAGGKLRGNGK